MENYKLKIQKFRTNDLNDNGGKQFELGKAWCEDYFGISSDVKETSIFITFKPLSMAHKNLDGTKIELSLSEVNIRGDRKAYANTAVGGCSQIKDFFINKLHLTVKNNLSDYFAFYKLDANEYLLFYVPELLYDNFIQLFKAEIPPFSVENKIDKTNIEYPLQQIYYGAPGTGKSHRIKKQLEEMNVPKENIFRTTFHPDSDYSSFVGAYKPTMKKQYRYDGKVKAKYYEDDDLAGAKRDDVIIDKVIQYDFVPQTFIKAYTQAYKKPNENVYLIIEEINRGNCAQIFGDLFQLLDRDENGVSEYPIKADSDLKMYLEGELGKNHDGIKDGELCLPSNLYIWATMNTSDQSLFPIDSAFKRRWDWEYEPIKYENSKWEIEIDGNMYSWTSFQEKVNNRIFEATNSEDKMLGDFFVKPNNNVISEKQFINKVLFYLWNDVCKDGDGDIFKTDDNKDVKFSDLYDTNASVTLKSMMKNLGIGPKSESEEYNGESETPESTDTERKTWNEIETKRYEFWEAFLNYAQQNTTFAKHFGGTKKPSKDHWKNFFISGNKDFYLVAVQQRKKNAAEVQVYFDQTNDTYHRLFENKEKIEQEMNVKYEWLELPEKKASVIKERKYNVDFEDKDKWNSIFDFYIDRLLRMKDVFVKYSK